MRKVYAVLAIAALAACSDEPTAVESAPSPEFGINNLSHHQLLWSYTATRDQAWAGYYIPCINNGQGEAAVTWGGPYEYWAKVVTTPSGRRHENGYFRLVPPGADYFEGVTTGEVWSATEYESKLGYQYFADGRWMITQPVEATYTSQRTGQQLRWRYEWHWIQDADGNIVGGNPRLSTPISCHEAK